jgi:hypothetical protein
VVFLINLLVYYKVHFWPYSLAQAAASRDRNLQSFCCISDASQGYSCFHTSGIHSLAAVRFHPDEAGSPISPNRACEWERPCLSHAASLLQTLTLLLIIDLEDSRKGPRWPVGQGQPSRSDRHCKCHLLDRLTPLIPFSPRWTFLIPTLQMFSQAV